MHIPFVDLKAQYMSVEYEIQAAIQSVLRSAVFVGGEMLEEFEAEFARYTGVRHAAGVASGTDALVLALRAVGIGPGDEVIVPAHTFIATAGAVQMAGATPVFVDVEPGTLTMDPAAVEAAITPGTAAVIPVHLYGQTADMEPILAVARRHRLFVIEDAAQAHGATYNGRPAGSIGHIGCFSFYPGKNLGAYGDGGAVTTNDPHIHEQVVRYRDHGRLSKYEHAAVGYNSRLDTVQAAVLRVKLRHLDRWNDARRAAAGLYDEQLAEADVQTPYVRNGSTHVYHLYAVRVPERELLQVELSQAGVVTGVHYPIPLHLQPAFEHLGYRRGELPESERAAEEVLSLPMYPELRRDQIEYISAVVHSCARQRLSA